MLIQVLSFLCYFVRADQTVNIEIHTSGAGPYYTDFNESHGCGNRNQHDWWIVNMPAGVPAWAYSPAMGGCCGFTNAKSLSE
jgi:hypothetical protein